ncbi:MAG TPA: hypothetical protein VGC87_04190 [Pyrinomonadaceae bacterium]
MKRPKIPETICRRVREAARERCGYKGPQTSAPDPLGGEAAPLFNPRHDSWGAHFRWSVEGVKIEGLTPTGRATVEALKLDNELAVEVRRNWVLAGWHPPAAEE